MKNDDMINFASGDPLLLFRAAAEEALRPSYEALRTYPADVEGYCAKALQGVPSFLDHVGITPPCYNDPMKSVAFTQGVTQGYSMTLEYLKRRNAALNKMREHYGLQQLQPAIIMPIPTYGFFRSPAHDHGIKIITIERDQKNDWQVPTETLKETLENIRANGKFHIIGYFDSNPNNPCGTIREQDETTALAEVFSQHNKIMEREDRLIDKQWLSNTSHQMMILDDMVYLGLQYNQKTPASFLTNPLTKDHTLVFLGLSKIGLVGFRAGLAVGHPRHCNQISHIFRAMQNSPEISSLGAAAIVFSGDSRRLYDRDTHLKELNNEHFYGKTLLDSLIAGAKQEICNSPTMAQMVRDVQQVLKCPADDAENKLKTGMKGVNFASNPEAGFFHLLDFEAYRPLKIPSIQRNISSRHLGQNVKDVEALHALFQSNSIRMLIGRSCGLPKERLIMRASHALPPKDIITGVERMRTALSYLKP